MTIGVPILNQEILKDHDFSGTHNYCSAELSERARENLIRLSFDERKVISTIVPTLGAKGALSLLFQILKIRKVALLAPYWLGYHSLSELNKIPMCIIHENTTDEIVDKMKMEEANALIVCNPNNPTGSVRSNLEMMKLITRLKEFDGVVLLDEVYKDLLFDKKNKFSDAIDAKNLIRIGSVSKSLGIPGLRLGYIQTMNIELIRVLQIFIQHNYTSLPSFIEYFLENIDLKYKKRYLSFVLPIYEKRMKKLKSLFEAHKYKVWSYDSAFYLYLESTQSNNLFEELKQKFGILSVSGVHYGHSLNCVRISTSVKEEDYVNLIKRLKQ
jgi:aspartate/methionine/tyrosine aminotransferase